MVPGEHCAASAAAIIHWFVDWLACLPLTHSLHIHSDTHTLHYSPFICKINSNRRRRMRFRRHMWTWESRSLPHQKMMEKRKKVVLWLFFGVVGLLAGCWLPACLPPCLTVNDRRLYNPRSRLWFGCFFIIVSLARGCFGSSVCLGSCVFFCFVDVRSASSVMFLYVVSTTTYNMFVCCFRGCRTADDVWVVLR